MSQDNSVHIVDATFDNSNELDKLIKLLKNDPKLTTSTSLKKFEQLPYKYDYWYSKTKHMVKIADRDGKIFDLIDKLLKLYDKVSD
jgi:hypothetical protein